MRKILVFISHYLVSVKKGDYHLSHSNLDPQLDDKHDCWEQRGEKELFLPKNVIYEAEWQMNLMKGFFMT